MPFGMGFGELVLVLVIVVVVFGAQRFIGPIELGQPRSDPREIRLVRVGGPERWTARDWLRVVVALGVGVAAAALIVARHSFPAR